MSAEHIVELARRFHLARDALANARLELDKGATHPFVNLLIGSIESAGSLGLAQVCKTPVGLALLDMHAHRIAALLLDCRQSFSISCELALWRPLHPRGGAEGSSPERCATPAGGSNTELSASSSTSTVYSVAAKAPRTSARNRLSG